ncbi:hypothetical protein [Herbaspirillum robiniae]|uniref:Uncharacterized protein n=1 Tax=Herbaspirillum robiniae TaxID=2014887 RepID=A0A246WMQ9_9BURK|nr:hypothetical protein [Herbaspirillum robiniae]OWY27643.1 hypothetical protein CEJ42_18985 [Herbaspirillum robiniae]
MARNPVTAVIPVDPVGAVRRVDSGSTYYRHLESWRIYSEVYAAERRARDRRDLKAGLGWVLSWCGDFKE